MADGAARPEFGRPDHAGRVGLVLPAVLAHIPPAVLLIDRRSGQVTYANRAAVDMAGQVGLPISLDQWGRASGLTDLDGRALGAEDDPLTRAATGHSGPGEAVRAPGAGGAGSAGDLLWVTGVPLSPPAEDDDLSLVVFNQVVPPEATDDPELALRALRERAIIATDMAFVITDARQGDHPVVWVNPAFSRITGYRLEDAVGRNCRFLQGAATDPETVALVRAAIAGARPVTVTLLNYRQDGTAFWNQLSITPVFDGDDRVVGFVGAQSDVTERVRIDAASQRALEAERTARIETEQAQGRLRLLAEATTQLSSTLDVSEALERLADVVVPSMADWVMIDLVGEQGDQQAVVIRHRTGQTRLVEQLRELQPEPAADESTVGRVIRGVEPLLFRDTDVEVPASLSASADLREVVRQLGLRSLMAVPLLARRRRVLGAIIMASGASNRMFTQQDLDVAADLGRRAGMTVENARLYEQEHRVAEILQRSLLPNLPDLDGLDSAAVYLPSNADADVGGDFYEVLPLPDGTIGIAVGDVVGHDLNAAAAMGHLRGLLRACAWDDAADEGFGDPAKVLNRVDRLMEGLDVAPLATLFYGRLRRPLTDGGPWMLTYANAGHPVPLLRLPDGTIQRLTGGAGTLLGVGPDMERRAVQLALDPGTALVAYTDGLVERRDSDTEVNIANVCAVLAQQSPTPCEGLVRRLVEILGDDREDDVAVIAVCLDS